VRGWSASLGSVDIERNGLAEPTAGPPARIRRCRPTTCAGDAAVPVPLL
jgi:hypothetical protein